jgi:hypothetical protein
MTNPHIPASPLGGAVPLPLSAVASAPVAITDLPQFQHLRDAAARTGPRPRFISEAKLTPNEQYASILANAVPKGAVDRSRRSARDLTPAAQPAYDARLSAIEHAVEQLTVTVAALRADVATLTGGGAS